MSVPHKRHKKWYSARTSVISSMKEKYGCLKCEKCGVKSSLKFKESIFHAHDKYPYYKLKYEIDRWSKNRLIENLVILCKYCHMLAPMDSDDFDIWFSQKSTPLGPITQLVIDDMGLAKYEDIIKQIYEPNPKGAD